MRNVVLAMMTTLNGRLDDPDAWWLGVSDDLYTDIDRMYEDFDTVLLGRTTYEEMSAYWPGAETEEGGSDTNKRMARKMNTYRKFVVSSETEQRTLDWNNSEPVVARCDAELVEFVSSLKSQSGGDIHVAGGARLAQSMVRLGLVDEVRFFVHPVVSHGAAWFDKVENKLELDLVSVKSYAHGVVGVCYTPRGLATKA